MKKNVTKAITIILALLMLVSCSNEVTKTNDSTTTTENIEVNSPDNTDNPPSNDTVAPDFLVESSRGEIASENTAKLFDKATAHGLGTQTVEIVSEKMKDTKKTLNISTPVELIYKTTEHQLISNDADQLGTFYCTYDEYVSADKLTKVKYLRDTETVSNYTSYQHYRQDVKLSEQELTKMAHDFIHKFVPKETLDRYTPNPTRYNETNGSLSLSYTLKIGDYKTDARISILIWSDGSVSSFQNTNYQKYDSLAQGITKEKIESVSKTLTERIKSITDYEITDIKGPFITTDVSGNVYVEISASCRFDDYSCGKLFYAKLAD